MINDRLELMEKRYEEINDLLSQPEICTDIKRMTELSKEQRSIEKVIVVYR